MAQVEGKGLAVCDCCGLLAPRRRMLPWQQQVLCRRLTSLPAVVGADGREDEWISGPYRCFYALQEYAVCDACFDYLLDGGEFAGTLRHRGKIACLALAAVLTIGIAVILSPIY
jgi:hypothetical protein